MVKWVRKVSVWPAVGLLVCCVVGGSALSACTKEVKPVETNVAGAVLVAGVPPIDAAAPGVTEKATFGMG
jgi:hypothetical protein